MYMFICDLDIFIAFLDVKFVSLHAKHVHMHFLFYVNVLHCSFPHKIIQKSKEKCAKSIISINQLLAR